MSKLHRYTLRSTAATLASIEADMRLAYSFADKEQWDWLADECAFAFESPKRTLAFESPLRRHLEICPICSTWEEIPGQFCAEMDSILAQNLLIRDLRAALCQALSNRTVNTVLALEDAFDDAYGWDVDDGDHDHLEDEVLG